MPIIGSTVLMHRSGNHAAARKMYIQKDKDTGLNTLSLVLPNLRWWAPVIVTYGNNDHNDEMVVEYVLDELNLAAEYGLKPGDQVVADKYDLSLYTVCNNYYSFIRGYNRAIIKSVENITFITPGGARSGKIADKQLTVQEANLYACILVNS